MGKEKFYYNTDTCKFEKVKKTNKDYFLNFIGLTVLILLASIGLVSIYDAYFESPKIIRLKKENSELQTHYEILNREVNIAYKMLENLEQRDDNIYRIIFETEPIPSSIRKVGIGGVNRYKDLLDGKLERESLLIDNYAKIDELKRKLYVQTKSYDDLYTMAVNKEELVAAIPAIQPVSNKDLRRLASGFGQRIDPFLKVKRMHYGLDFSIKVGTPIYATADGKAVIVKTSFGGFGKHIYLDHGNGYKTVYAHLDKFNIKRGQKVKRGELIAYSGNSGRSTAPHLHYEVHKNGKKVNPINFFFNDLTPNQYEEVIKIASIENQALGSTY
ncbi:MAG: M23 family metallopeptidase [Flammeovirgaceae bacterium TMED290]|nr:MAG: M23 family metallopeptidase [Flammeovirgaceae bacterium TMED290]|tara:strand:- start:2554 stop:3540 length:987 start_codon:yes stop_codon:yes gene_type:complete